MQREKIQSSGRGKRFEGEGGVGVASLAKGGQIEQWTRAGGIQGESHSVICRRSRNAPGVRSRSKSCQEF